jgi:DNA-binding Lrp family transcriptional regulator
MTRFERDCIKERILNLARLKCTGTPSDLGEKFEISERSVKRIVKEMREEGIDIRYDYASLSYVKVEK